MGLRRMGSAQRTRSRAKTRKSNGLRKARERVSRDRRVLEFIQGKSLPFEPWVMSYFNAQLGKPTWAITQADVEQAVEQARGRIAKAETAVA